MGTRDRVAQLLAHGYSRAEIASELGISRPAVSRHTRLLGHRDARLAEGIPWHSVRAMHDSGHSLRDCQTRFGFSARALREAIARGEITVRAHGIELKPSEKRAEIKRLLDLGWPQALIAVELGLSKATVSYHARKLGLPARDDFARRYDWAEVQRAYDSGLSVRQCAARFGFNLASWTSAVRRGDVIARPTAMPLEMLLVVGRKTSRHHLKTRLLREGLKENRCERCGITEWRGEPLSMQLHHVNGDGGDNRIENLELLCPNCHAQTDTYGGRNGHRRKRRTAAEG